MGKITAKDIIEKDIIELLGGQVLDDNQRAQLYKRMMETINLRAIERIDNQLNDEDKRGWQAKVEEGDNDKIAEYLAGKGVDVAEIMAQEALRYKAELVSFSEYQKESGRIYDEATKMLIKNKPGEAAAVEQGENGSDAEGNNHLDAEKEDVSRDSHLEAVGVTPDDTIVNGGDNQSAEEFQQQDISVSEEEEQGKEIAVGGEGAGDNGAQTQEEAVNEVETEADPTIGQETQQQESEVKADNELSEDNHQAAGDANDNQQSSDDFWQNNGGQN